MEREVRIYFCRSKCLIENLSVFKIRNKLAEELEGKANALDQLLQMQSNNLEQVKSRKNLGKIYMVINLFKKQENKARTAENS